MKKIIVGRAFDSDVVIPDDKDNVSRHHLVISFGFDGKMKVSDTSSNGTYINGTKMVKGASVPVTRKDTIRLGDNWTLDWKLVKDPYRKLRALTYAGIFIFTLFVCVGGGIAYYYFYVKPDVSVADPAAPTDSLLPAPQEEGTVAPQTEDVTETKGKTQKAGRNAPKKARKNEMPPSGEKTAPSKRKAPAPEDKSSFSDKMPVF